jgi:glycosyltransferase involved in cell wall biosynthesis
MRILVASDYASTWNMGGATRVLAHQLQSIAASEHEGLLISGGPKEDHGHWGIPWVKHRYKSPFYLPKLYLSFLQARFKFKPDILHLHQPIVALLAHWAYPKSTTRVYHFHSYWKEEKLSHARGPISKAWSHFKGWIENTALRNMEHFIVLSRYSEKRLRERQPNANIQVIPGAVDTEYWKPKQLKKGTKDGIFQFLSVRRLDPRMGLDLLIQAFAKLVNDKTEMACHLNIVGTGRSEKDLKTLCSKLSLNEHITFHGRVPEEQLLQLMHSSHAVAIPTREMEGFGMSVIEAFAAGLPVLATEAGALGEFSIHGDVIQMVGTPSVENLSSGLKSALSHWANNADISSRCLKVAKENYDKDIITQKLLQLYEERVKSPSSHHLHSSN